MSTQTAAGSELITGEADEQQGSRTSGEEGTDHEAEVDCSHGEDQQENKDQRGVTVGQHCSIRLHLRRQINVRFIQLWFT